MLVPTPDIIAIGTLLVIIGGIIALFMGREGQDQASG